MAFFNINKGLFKRVSEVETIDPGVVEWLLNRLSLHDSILPEKLMVFYRGIIKDAENKIPDNETAAEEPIKNTPYLLALDKNAISVVVFVMNSRPTPQDIGKKCDFAWTMRHLTYHDLDAKATKYFTDNGVAIDDLAHHH
jgi:hypothetical protein